MTAMYTIVYIAWNKYRYLINYSFNPLLDLKYHNEVWDCQRLQVLTPPLPIGLGYYIFTSISTPEEQAPGNIRLNNKSKLFRWFNSRLRDKSLNNIVEEKFIKATYILQDFLISPVDDVYSLDSCLNINLPPKSETDKLAKKFQGKILYPEEIINSLSGQALKGEIEDILQILYLENKLKIVPAIALESDGKIRCLRCGRTNVVKEFCFECGSESCYACIECNSFGEARFCKPMYAFVSSKQAKLSEKFDINFNFSLSQPQRSVERELLRVLRDTGCKRVALWAAPGAGKKEVTFSAIASVLRMNGKVLYTSSDIRRLNEAYKSFKNVFKNIHISFYSDKQVLLREGPLTVAALPQLIRINDNYDLVIVDQYDVLPHQEEETIFYCAERACKKEGKVIFFTSSSTAIIEDEKIDKIYLPARYHGCPLPIPELLEKDNKILDFLHMSIEGDLAQVLIFSPSEQLTKKVADRLQRAMELPPFNNFSGDWVRFTFLRDIEREEKVKSFISGDFPIFITTVLQDNVITPRLNIIVLDADQFGTGTLFHLAGLSGRFEQYPNGRVWFLGNRITKEMRKSVFWTKKMNEIALNKGYLEGSKCSLNF